MRQPIPRKIVFLACVLLFTALSVAMMPPALSALPNLSSDATTAPKLLSDPFLQAPSATSVQVVWFTEFEGIEHRVEYGDDLRSPSTAIAVTTQLSRTREDADSNVPGRTYTELTARPIWRHEATVAGLTAGKRLGYRVMSQTENGQQVQSDRFTLSPAPSPGQPLKILLTSDHQLKPLTPANLQKVEELLAEKGTGPLDAIFFAGDLVNVPDRASEWFDDAGGLAFFPGLQGHSTHLLEKEGSGQKGPDKTTTTTNYKGGQLIQHTPLFPIVVFQDFIGLYSDIETL